jgi:type IV secretory pathway protease TraF
MLKILRLVILATIAFFIPVLLGTVFTINVTPSVPLGIYVWNPHGNYIIIQKSFSQNSDEMIGNVLKLLAGRPGDVMHSDSSGVYVNERHFPGRIHSIDKQFYFSGIIPDGKYLPLGTHPESYDGRYYGFISEEDIIMRCSPLILFQ